MTSDKRKARRWLTAAWLSTYAAMDVVSLAAHTRWARRAVAEWQSASNRNKLLLLTLTNVTYSIDPGGGQ